MAAAGMGMALLSCFLGDQDRRVQRVPGTAIMKGRDLWMLTHQDLRQTARVKALMTFAKETLKVHKDLFAGKCPHPDPRQEN